MERVRGTLSSDNNLQVLSFSDKSQTLVLPGPLTSQVLLNSHKDGVIARITAKRLPQPGVYEFVFSRVPCAKIYGMF